MSLAAYASKTNNVGCTGTHIVQQILKGDILVRIMKLSFTKLARYSGICRDLWEGPYKIHVDVASVKLILSHVSAVADLGKGPSSLYRNRLAD